jgi:sialic acid synthase SpsE
MIAELGVNHDGSLDRALSLTRAAREAGADAVKLQLFAPRLLLSSEAALAEYQKGSAADVFDMLASLQLGVDAMREVRALAHELEMGFIVTPFSIELAGALASLDPDAVKIASPDAVNLPLIEAMLALGKPMLVSTGTCGLDELAATAALLRGRPAAMLHCVSAYPVAAERADLGRIGRLRSRFQLPVGYSDHTTGLHSGMLAVASQGACIVERHLTYDRGAAGPDHAASLDPVQFAQYVALIREAEASLRAPAADDATEAEVRRLSRQSVCAARAIRRGARIRRDDLTAKRPGTGIPAGRLAAVVGQWATRDIDPNTILRAADVSDQPVVEAVAKRRSA